MDKTNKTLLIAGGILIFLLIVIVIISKGGITGNPISEGKEVCPYTCCPEGEFYKKTCSQDYECISNSCVAIDSDGDGLTNIEEQSLGTNPQVYDSDGDTLSDYQEVKNLGTNPLKRNTDSDRYDDNEDYEPLVVNSAYIDISLSDLEWNWNYINILLAIMGGSVVSPEMEIAEPSVKVFVRNEGDDYTQYVNFDVVFELQNTEVERSKISLSRMNIADSRTEVYSKKITAGDVPDMLINLVLDQSTDWRIKIEDLDYERF